MGTYMERLCVYDGYWGGADSGAPVFFYTGNESPVEEYVNNSGLVWDLAAEVGALIVFAEHRYFGESIPAIEGMPNCLSYLSSQEALADYASIINVMRREWGCASSAFIAFGGSYGGMLASWLRIMYPHAVDGAIAASAPIWGFPLDQCPLDGSARTVTTAASPAGGSAERCADNLKAAYVLIGDLAKTAEGRDALSTAMGLCTPLRTAHDTATLLGYLQSPLFNLAEGSYPFPTDYITFALTYSTIPLPAWPMRVMCDDVSADYGIKLSGSPETVQFTVAAPSTSSNGGSVEVFVNWDMTTNNGYSVPTDVQTGSPVLQLAADVASAIQIWYNLTGSETCVAWDGEPAPNAKAATTKSSTATIASSGDSDSNNVCTMSASDFDAGTGWNTLTCNEGLSLVNWWVQGVGNDLYWPPNVPSNYSFDDMVAVSLDYCTYYKASQGLYGLPEPGHYDVYSLWDDTTYGGLRFADYATNIVFSNGNLDPWIAAGVHFDGDAATAMGRGSIGHHPSVQSLVIDQGGHHLDLFFPTDEDPQSVIDVRKHETAAIKGWIAEVAERYNARRSV